MFPRSLKITAIQNLVQITSPCSQGLARCHVTIRQRCKRCTCTETLCNSKSPEVEEIFLFFQIGKELASWRVQGGTRFRPRWEQRCTDHQCTHFPSLREAATSAAASASRADPVIILKMYYANWQHHIYAKKHNTNIHRRIRNSCKTHKTYRPMT